MSEAPDEKSKGDGADRSATPGDELRHAILYPKCDLCGSLMLESHCKLICPMCGYLRVCSDP